MLADQFVAWRRIRVRHVAIAVAVLLVAAVLNVVAAAPKAKAAGSPCGANINPIACENSQTDGVADQSVWDVDGAGDSDIQGFGTDMSVNAGSTINFKIKTSAAHYTIDIYRLGYYGGAGARRQAPTINVTGPSNASTACVTDPSVSLVDCGNWSVSASWAVPSTAVSGVYIAHLTRTDNADESLITFIVRDDASTSDIIYQTSDETWEAYNRYGQYNFYTGALDNLWDSPSRARKLSYNRPFATRDDNSGRDFLFSNEYPTIRFLEQNGYDVSYMAGVDADRYGSLLKGHKVYLSVGHDEYWSGNQRTNVEAARDAGVNLMFLSGNEVYWHTRFESSIDGSNTPYRTLVCYKMTWDNAQTDPTGTSTATWRDPRFATAPGGSNPENALTGTMYMSNNDDLAVTVTKDQGKLRLWRGTSLGIMSGSSTALAPHTIGYESDEDVDNGFRPAGLMDLSTTTGSTPEELVDFGNTTKPGTTTHHLTLYRASSGALVFGAGTIQWAWGLDEEHDGTQSPADSRMQQATVNMLADMHAQPTTLMGGLVAATASTDTQAPTTTITSPSAGAAIPNGTSLTVTGTSADLGGGQVSAVEVSLDGGNTWHPATGTTSWTYTAPIFGDGPTNIEARASDDSANLASPSVIGVNTRCPCSLFGNVTPKTTDVGDPTPVELGVRFTATAGGSVSGIRFYKSAANTGSHVGTLWTAAGQQLAQGTFTGETASGWQTLQFSSPVSITPGATYVASYYAPNGHYAADYPYFYYRDVNAPPLRAESNSPTTTGKYNGVYVNGHGFPNQTYLGSNYYVDVVFADAEQSPPGISAQTPTADATGVDPTTSPSVTFTKTMSPATIVFTVKDSAGNTIAGTVNYDSGARTATFSHATPFAGGTTFTATVSATDSTGMSISPPAKWRFTTSGTPTCPCSLFPDNPTPTTVDSGDVSGVNLGVRFQSSINGYVTGVRFYKAATNTGTHVGALWTASGTKLVSGSFTNETASGWQSLQFDRSIAITAGTAYIASYYAPNGHYSDDASYFAANYLNGVLSAPAGANGVYLYGSSDFPNLSYNSTNYWVDPVFDTTPALDTTPPSVTAETPTPGATNVPASVDPTATFSEPVNAASMNFVVRDRSGTSVPGSVSYANASQTATFTPTAALSTGATFTASVSATDVAGNAMTSPTIWKFTTGGTPVCPCTLLPSNATPANADSNDATAVNLGVKIVPSVNGQITGVRFYKSAANVGTHVGAVWSASGTQLATVTFSNETDSGWQTATFSTPVSVAAGSTYVVSYFAPSGHYSDDPGFFSTDYVNGPLTAPGGANGVFGYGSSATFPSSDFGSTNYWVDPVFTAGGPPPPDTTPPAVTGVTATGTGNTSATVSWTTDENATSRVDYGTSATNLNLNASTAGLSTSHSVPLTGLAPNTRYYYRVTSADAAGNSTTSPATTGAPASYAPTTTPLTDATSADFGAGTASSTYVAGNGDGEVVLTPTVAQEFSGTALPSGWTSSPVVTGGTSTVANGSVTVSGANLSSTATYTNGKSLELLATLDKNQSIGWVGRSSSSVKINLTVNASNQLIASVNDGVFNNATGVAVTGWTAAPHRFRFEWTSSAATIYVDDVQKYTHAFQPLFTPNLKPLLSDSVRTDANLSVDWLRVGPYAASGTFTSRVFDGQAAVTWDGLSWDATVPSGTTLVVKVRAGNTPTPDATWTAFATIPSSGGSIGQTKRYVQYQLTLTSTGSRFTTAQVRSVTAAFHV